MKIIMLWKRTSTFTKKRLQTPQMCIFQEGNLQSMRLPNLVCWTVAKDYGNGGAINYQFMMVPLTNHLWSK